MAKAGHWSIPGRRGGPPEQISALRGASQKTYGTQSRARRSERTLSIHAATSAFGQMVCGCFFGGNEGNRNARNRRNVRMKNFKARLLIAALAMLLIVLFSYALAEDVTTIRF